MCGPGRGGIERTRWGSLSLDSSVVRERSAPNAPRPECPKPRLDLGRICSIITVGCGSHSSICPCGRGVHSTAALIPRAIAGFGVKGAKRSPLTKWKSWKSWAKETKAVIGAHQNVKNNGISRADSMFMRKGGVAGGVKNAKSLGKYAVQSGQTRSISSAFWSESCEFGRV